MKLRELTLVTIITERLLRDEIIDRLKKLGYQVTLFLTLLEKGQEEFALVTGRVRMLKLR